MSVGQYVYNRFLPILRIVDNDTNRFGVVDYDIEKALKFAREFIHVPNLDDPHSVETHKDRGTAYIKFSQSLENRDTTIDWYEWHKMADNVCAGLGNVDTIRDAYEHLSVHP